MKKKHLLWLVLLLYYAAHAQTSPPITKTKKVLIIGIDGCRPDILLYAKTPNIDKIWQNGAYLFCAQTDPISFSGICWTGMLTGVWHKKHNVLTNSYKNPNTKEYPHFFHRVKEQFPYKKTASVVNWSPVNKILQKGDADIVETYTKDEKVAERAIAVLKEENPDVLFVHFDNVDHTGHSKQYSLQSKPYIKSIEDVDTLVGKVVNSLKDIPKSENDEWYIIISTDHGGNAYNHGKNIPVHTSIFFIVNGKEVTKGEILEPVNVIDVAVTAMHILGVDIKKDWNLDGKIQGFKK